MRSIRFNIPLGKSVKQIYVGDLPKEVDYKKVLAITECILGFVEHVGAPVIWIDEIDIHKSIKYNFKSSKIISDFMWTINNGYFRLHECDYVLALVDHDWNGDLVDLINGE